MSTDPPTLNTCGALRSVRLGWSFARPFPLLVELCGASENVAAPEGLPQVVVQGLELVVSGISVAPPNAALRKMLSEKSPIVASMSGKPQILGLCMCLKKKNNIPICF